MSDFLKVLNERTSVEYFDSATPISVQEIKESISQACQAPSSFNIQHWREPPAQAVTLKVRADRASLQ
jgi:nitroreductase